MRRYLSCFCLVILVGACAPEEQGPEERDQTAAEATGEMPAEPVPIEGTTDLTIEETDAPSLLESATLSTAGSDEDDDEFEVGETLDLRVRVLEVPPKLAAWVHWFGPDDERIAEEQKPVADDGTVTFSADTSGWASGLYAAEIYVGGDLAETKAFRLNETDGQSANE
ncbi:MAG: hypothetical protein R3338_10800 [Thermoanaerobaculia bacterium]|nr:hypothetical protein [Thermoanaerobaculia bacterium]